MFLKLLEARINDIWNLYVATGGIAHSGEKGLLRELFLQRILESILPPHFGLGSGIVVDNFGNQSPQADIIIFDRRKIPPLLEQNGHGIYPFDAVLRIIEVKSTLNKPGLIQFMKLVESINPANPDGLKLATKGKLENGYSYYPFASLFAYKSEIGEVNSILKNLGLPHPQRIFTVNHGDSIDPVKVRAFLIAAVGEIEMTAYSRGEFSITEWILKNNNNMKN